MFPLLARPLAVAMRCVLFRHTRNRYPLRAPKLRLGGELLETRLALSASGFASLAPPPGNMPAEHGPMEVLDHSAHADARKHGGADNPANHDRGHDQGQLHREHGVVDQAQVIRTEVSHQDGSDRPSIRETVEDDQGQPNGGQETEDEIASTATDSSTSRGADDPADHDANDQHGVQGHRGRGR